MTQQELLTILLQLRQIDDPQKSSRFWNSFLGTTDELTIELEHNSFVIRCGEYGVRLFQLCGFAMIEIFDRACCRSKSIERDNNELAWRLLNTTLAKLRSEASLVDDVSSPTSVLSTYQEEGVVH
jgi:hypothetical protein